MSFNFGDIKHSMEIIFIYFKYPDFIYYTH